MTNTQHTPKPLFYNPQRPNWSGITTEWHEYDAQVNATTAFTFNADSFEAAREFASQYGAYQLTQFARPLRVVREAWLNRAAITKAEGK